MPNESVRVRVALDYKGRSWGTVQVDLSPGEGDGTKVEMVEPLGLDTFGLDTPDALPCISLRYHIAQKIHAMTEPPLDDATPNERFRDLVDLLLMRELTSDLGEVRAACVDVFTVRAKHQWPPVLEPPAGWDEPFASLADEVELPCIASRTRYEKRNHSSKISRGPRSPASTYSMSEYVRLERLAGLPIIWDLPYGFADVAAEAPLTTGSPRWERT